ncbi:MAG: SOS response-associated peptidase [Planctomycetota bacterium]|nr:MAG: SOS response-associated peptidase [Planctomycetota bacterium]
MCGRFALFAPRADVARFLAADLPEEEELRPRWNIAPTQAVPAAIGPEGARRIRFFHWGLIPPWARDRSFAARMINARAETVAEKPAFRAAFRARRGLVPMSGFYEWRREGRLRRPWFFRPPDGGLLAAAALWERWRDPENGREILSLALLTTAANRVMAPIHHRMPVLLDAAGRRVWTDPEADPDHLRALLRPAPEETLAAWPVDPRVNRASWDRPDCVEPLAPEDRIGD